MGRIAQNLLEIQRNLGPNTQLVVVSKHRSTDEIQEAYNCGQRIFAENRVQALLERQRSLPHDIEWHLIGHLQTNKAKNIAPFITLIHSADSVRLLTEIDIQAKKNNRIIDCLLQVFIASEETKFGFSDSELIAAMDEKIWEKLTNIRIVGLMGMASNTSDKTRINAEFAHLKMLFSKLKEDYFSDAPYFKELSCGMSSDYPLAIKNGSTMVRIGSSVFE